MGRARNIFDLALAGGAIIGIATVVSPLLSIETDLSSFSSAQAVTAKAPVELGHLLGIAQFVKAPTAYQFNCDGKSGEVTGATLVGDRMTITYQYAAEGETKTGKLTGIVNSDGVFSGDYLTKSQTKSQTESQTEAKTESLEGDVRFTFAADGTAKGTYSDGAGKMQISL